MDSCGKIDHGLILCDVDHDVRQANELMEKPLSSPTIQAGMLEQDFAGELFEHGANGHVVVGVFKLLVLEKQHLIRLRA